MKPEDCNTLQDYRNFFAEIPEERWAVGIFVDEQGSCCAYGHLGDRWGASAEPAERLVAELNRLKIPESLIAVNDGYESQPYKQGTPKQRVLAFLDDAIALQLTKV